MNNFMKGITAGAVIGTAVSMIMMPQMDRSSRRRIKRTGRMLKNTAEDMYDDMMKRMR